MTFKKHPTPDDSTPNTPAVIEVLETLPPPPVSPSRKVAALATMVAGLAFSTINGTGPKTPKLPPVTARDEENGDCEVSPGDTVPHAQDIFGIDGIHARAGDYSITDLCPPITSGDPYKEMIHGFEAIPETGKPYRCFIGKAWAPDTAIQLAGTAKGDRRFPGIIHLEDGLIDLTTGIDTDSSVVKDDVEVHVEAEASLIIKTTGRVSIVLLPPKESEDGVMESFIRITSMKGETIITQEGREEPIILQGCEQQDIPLFVNEQSLGCYIAEGAPGAGRSPNGGGKLILLAGAAFLALRRRKKSSTA